LPDRGKRGKSKKKTFLSAQFVVILSGHQLLPSGTRGVRAHGEKKMSKKSVMLLGNPEGGQKPGAIHAKR